jgi:phosphotransacetylase
VETVSDRLPSTLDAAALCKMAERGQITGGLLDGPLGFDNAINEAAAVEKGIVSQVAGRADILVVPDLEPATCWPSSSPSSPGQRRPAWCWALVCRSS